MLSASEHKVTLADEKSCFNHSLIPLMSQFERLQRLTVQQKKTGLRHHFQPHADPLPLAAAHSPPLGAAHHRVAHPLEAQRAQHVLNNGAPLLGGCGGWEPEERKLREWLFWIPKL